MSAEVENVRVVVRVRPLNKREIDAGYEEVTEINPECKQISLLKPGTDIVKTFTFDKILREDCTQVGFWYLSFYIHFFLFYMFVDRSLLSNNSTCGR